MKLAIMQPYFFPYIGYWQLIHASNRFLLLDDVQYMRHGWINRNRILKPDNSSNEGWQYIIAPLVRHSATDAIRELSVCDLKDWRKRILAQIDHYKKKAPYYVTTRELVKSALYETADKRIAYINFAIIRYLSRELELECEILLSSELSLDYSKVSDAGEWALEIAGQMGAFSYINPISGAELFDESKFSEIQVEVQFLQSKNICYPQYREKFEPALSIIDVLMFNGVENTRRYLQEYALHSSNINLMKSAPIKA